MPKPNLIMGVWNGPALDRLEYFFRSLRESGYAGDVCLFAFGLPAAAARQLQRMNVILPEASHFLGPEVSVQSSRYFMYLDFLRHSRTLYANVLLTDPHDTILQSDPFQIRFKTDLVFAIERKLIRDCKTNRFHLQAAYGEIPDHVKNAAISCAGMSLGTAPGTLRYLKAMCQQIKLYKDTARIIGIDQAHHNHLLHTKSLESFSLDRRNLVFAPVQHIPAASLTLDAGIRIDGATPPIIYQWERHANLADYVKTDPHFSTSDVKSAPMAEKSYRISQAA